MIGPARSRRTSRPASSEWRSTACPGCSASTATSCGRPANIGPDRHGLPCRRRARPAREDAGGDDHRDLGARGRRDPGPGNERRREEADQAELVMDEQAPDLDTAERRGGCPASTATTSRRWSSPGGGAADRGRVPARRHPGCGRPPDPGEGSGRAGSTRDLKTTRRPQQPFQHAPQLGAHALLYATEGFEVDDAQIDLLRRTQIDKPCRCRGNSSPGYRGLRRSAHADGRVRRQGRGFAKDGNPSRFLPNSASFFATLLLPSARLRRLPGDTITSK